MERTDPPCFRRSVPPVKPTTPEESGTQAVRSQRPFTPNAERDATQGLTVGATATATLNSPGALRVQEIRSSII